MSIFVPAPKPIVVKSKYAPLYQRPEILLHYRIPRPLHKLAPRVVLGSTWWNKTRLTSYVANNSCCWACGRGRDMVGDRLESHELYRYDFKAGTITFVEASALCAMCHNFIHKGRMQRLVDDGLMTMERMEMILDWGNGILANAGLKSLPYPKVMAPWGKWRLVLFGKEYGPKWKSALEWAIHFKLNLTGEELVNECIF